MMVTAVGRKLGLEYASGEKQIFLIQSKFRKDWGQTWFWIGLNNNIEWQTLVVYSRKGVLRVKDKYKLK